MIRVLFRLLSIFLVTFAMGTHSGAHAYSTNVGGDTTIDISGSLNVRGEATRVRKRTRNTSDNTLRLHNVMVLNGKLSNEKHMVVTQVRPYMTSKIDPDSTHYSRVAIDEFYWDAKVTDSVTTTVGRRQLVNGVALGYNPTDFLSHEKRVTGSNLTDTERRSERTGHNMVGLSKFFDTSTLEAYLIFPSSFTSDPLRALVQFSHRIQALQTDYKLSAYYDDSLKVGINISTTLSNSITGYFELALSNSRGRKEADNTWRDEQPLLKLSTYDAVLGVQYTHDSGVGLNVEYWHSNAGYKKGEVDTIYKNTWMGKMSPDDAEDLLFANNNLQKNKVFARISDIPLTDDFTLDQTGILGLSDKSFFSRTSLIWHATEASTFRLNLNYFSGTPRAEFGIIPYEWQLFSSYKFLF